MACFTSNSELKCCRVVDAAGSVVSGQIYNVAAEHLRERDVVIATAKATGVTGELKY